MATLSVKATAVLGAAMLVSAAGAQAPASVSQGNYECWAHGRARPLMNFKFTGSDRYSDPDGKQRGTFTYNAATGAITFKGGHLDGVMPTGFTSVYHEKNKKPTVSFRGQSGEAQFCEKVAR
ncbi:MAG: hypothetical protein IAE92_05225 [Burkholderiaceae bacterium]|nr:hypothetical protein [Burkholderiaceae bacterium]